MPELNQLGLNEQAAPQVDWDAPPPGLTPPCVIPGSWYMKLVMPEKHEDWFDAPEREMIKGKPETKRKVLEVIIEPEVIADSQRRPVAAEDGSVLKLPPQQFNTFMSPKMRIHRLAELLRGCGVRIEGSIVDQIDDVMKQLNGQAIFEAEVIWRAYFKSTDTTVSTHPRGKASGELLWPRDAAGNWELMATNPQTGEKAYGYPSITSIKMPSAVNGENLGTAAT